MSGYAWIWLKRSKYGAVTTGFEWAFLKLEGSIVLIDTQRYYLNDLSGLLSIFQYIVDQFESVFS